MSSKRLTSLKFNSEFSPEKCWWEDYFPFLLGARPFFRSHVKLREGRFFLAFLRIPSSLWGDFYTSWASPGWRRYHLCITRGDQEDCNLSSTSVSEMGEVGGSESWSHTPGFGGEVGGWFAEAFSAKTNIWVELEKNRQKSMNQWDERASFFLGCLKPSPHFFGGNEWVKLWNCGGFFFQTFGAWIRGGLDMFLNNVSDRRWKIQFFQPPQVVSPCERYRKKNS